jgi:hypothetical protein
MKLKSNSERPQLACGCPLSPKADLGKKWGFANGRLRAQTGIHSLGQLQKFAVTFVFCNN